ncbi:MAG: hypothetical protein PHD61_08835 [Bacteroidales bacterium]|nr:hypothetical protein [Bacteroidales bacterium]
MRKVIKLCCLLFPVFLSLPAHSQAPDTLAPAIDSTYVGYFLEKDFIFSPIAYHPIDTSLTFFQKYDPALYPASLFATLGNIGLATHDLSFSLTPTLQLQTMLPAFDLYRYQHENTRFYSSVKPYSELFYVMGKYREQYFTGDISEKIGKQLVVGMNFRFINAFGGYPRQRSDDKNVVLKTNYFTKNQRYGIIADYIHNNLTPQENGGIEYDSVFKEKIETYPKRLTVNLTSSQNKWKENSFHLSHYVSLTRPADTVTENWKTAKILQPGSISHVFKISKSTLTYTDDKIDTLFYPAVYLDSTSTKDASQISSMENTLAWSNSRNSITPVILTLGVKYQYNRIRYFSHDSLLFSTDLNHLYYSAILTLKPFKGLELKGEAELSHGDYQKGDTRITAWVTKKFRPGVKDYLLSGTVSFISQTPCWYSSYYVSNYFQWDNTFDKENLLHAGLKGILPYLDIAGDYYHYSHYMYFGFDALPVQAEKTLDVFQIKAHSPVHLRKVSLDAWVIYQQTPQQEILRLPALSADLSAYFNQVLFKGALSTQLGFDLHYQSGYLANAYMPSSRVFYLQDEKKLPSVMILDIVWKFKVQRARFFLLYHHLNSLFGKHDYYYVPHYPLQDARFKFGVSWRFQD